MFRAVRIFVVLEKRSTHRYKSVKHFDAAHSPAGLLERYCHGRNRAFLLRVGVAIIGCLFLGFVVSVQFGLFLAIFTISLELMELYVLKAVIARGYFRSPWISRKVTFVSFLQTNGIAVCIFLTGIQAADLRMVAWAFLLGAVLNSMLTAHYHPPSHHVRIWVLSMSGLLVLVKGLWDGHLSFTVFWCEIAALGAMGLMLWHLMAHLARRDARMKNAERRLLSRSEEAERLALVAKHASDSILLLDPEMKIQWTNPQFTKVTGYSAKEALGQTAGALLNHPNTSQESVDKLIEAARAKKPVNLRILNKTKDGRPIWVETHQTPVMDETNAVSAYIAVERDATDLVARERQLRLALVAAKEADREKTAFLSRMSHELRTPANGIIGGMEMLRETDVCEVQEDALNVLDVSANRLMALVDNVLTMTGTKEGSVQSTLEPMMMTSIFSTLGGEFQDLAVQKGIELHSEVDLSAMGVMRSDPSVIHGVLHKLVDNAIKFTHDGHVQMKTRLEPDGWLHITVEDTGVGIPSDKLHEIFDPFDQVDEADTRNHDGAGLGLSTASNLIALLGGRVRASSVLGQGSKFKVKVPVERIDDADETENLETLSKVVQPSPEQTQVAPLGALAVKTPGGPSKTKRSGVTKALQLMENGEELANPTAKRDQDGPQMHLLVAEDNRTNRMLIKSMLKSAGHLVEFAEDGVQAVAQYLEKQPDFVLMDLSMPNKNGLDATREIRAFEAKSALRRCPIVAVTANVTEDDRRKCFDAGMDAFLAKPLKKTLLLETIGEVSA